MTMARQRPVVTVAVAAVLAAFLSSTDAGDLLPKGWIGGNIADYDIGVDGNAAKEGKACAYIKSKTQTPKSFGTIV